MRHRKPLGKEAPGFFEYPLRFVTWACSSVWQREKSCLAFIELPSDGNKGDQEQKVEECQMQRQKISRS